MDHRMMNRAVLSALVLAMSSAMTACGGGAVMSGIAAGRVGSSLAVEAQYAPRGGLVCGLREASLSVPGTAETKASEACQKAARSDELWREAMVVLAAHGERLGEIASGVKPEHAGRMSVAMTGVTGPDFAEPEGAAEKAARDAVVELVKQIAGSKSDLSRSVTEAAGPVKTLCDGLESYLTNQVGAVAETRSELEKKRSTMADRRCAAVEGNRTVCVSQSVLDRVTYATAFDDLDTLARSHMHTRDSVRAFCIVHRKLEEAAAKGHVSKEQTWVDIVNSVQSLPRTRLRQSPSAGK